MCGEDHGGHDRGGGVHLCRDCDLEYSLDGMQCSGCRRMRYATDAPASLSQLAEVIWGERCVCPEPRPPSVRTAKRDVAIAKAERMPP